MKILKNSLWNIAAIAIPMIVALPVLGILSRSLGVERFGLFTLIFALVGFASIFDAGLSRAVTREVAISNLDKNRIKQIVNTSSCFLLVAGLLSLFICFIFHQNIILSLNVSETLYQDLENALIFAYLIIPVFLLTLVRYSLYEGIQFFSLVSKVRIFSNILLSIIPLFFVLYEQSLSFAIIGLLTARIISFFIILYVSHNYLREAHAKLFHIGTFIRLIKFGGWVTVSNVISPVMSYFDRFILSNISGAGNVAYYTGPAEAVAKMVSLPLAISRVLFPSIAANESSNIYKLTALMGVLALVVTLPIFIFSSQIMAIWLGPEFEKSGIVLRVLLIGFVFNAMAQIPFTYIQAKNKAKLTALIHLVELIPYLCVLYLLINEYGYLGAALAWSLRVAIDFLILTLVSKLMDNSRVNN